MAAVAAPLAAGDRWPWQWVFYRDRAHTTDSWLHALAMMLQLCDGLAHISEQQIAHRGATLMVK
jgi:hypothetical protein